MKKIAIIDDEENIISVLEKYLLRKGKVEIDTYTKAKQATSKIMSGSYDLILLDIMMPEINGLDMLADIKKARPSQKVLMMTAYTTEEKIIKSDSMGADDYITKPFISLRDVENKIYDHLHI